MRKFILFLVLFVLLLFQVVFSSAVTDSTKVQIELKTYLEASAVPQNREVIYHVELSWKGDLDRFQILDVSEPAVTNLKIRGSGSSNKFFIDSDGNPFSIKRITYYFLPQELGMAYIDGLIIRYEDKVRGNVEKLSAQRLQVTIDDPVKDGNASGKIGTIIFWLFLILFLLATAFYTYRYFQRRDAADFDGELAEKSPEEMKMDELRAVDEDHSMKYNEKVQAMSRLLNKYFNEKFGLDGSVEYESIENRLKSLSLDDAILRKIKNFMEQASLAKFAGKEVSETDYQLYYDTLEMTFTSINTVVSKTEED